MRLAESTWTDVRDADGRLAVLPVGAIEQHGPHAPLGTDALTAVGVAETGAAAYERGADLESDDPEIDPASDDSEIDPDAAAPGSDDEPIADRDPVIVAPPVSVGVSEEHRAFDGTLWVAPETFRAYVSDVIESLAAAGRDRVVIVNGHGGNVDALAEVARQVSRDGGTDAYAVAFTWFQAVGDHGSDMGHGGPLETALLRHLHPKLVREDRIEAARDGGADRWGEWVAGANLAHDSDEFTDNGVVGDPAAGDTERGAELLSLSATGLAELLAAVADR